MVRSVLPPRAANVAVLSDTDRVSVTPVDLQAEDGAPSTGLLYQPRGRTSRVGVHLMHPRTDQTRNYNIGPLVGAGVTVLSRSSRSVNNDVETLHEDLLLDVAAGVRHLRELGCESVVLLGNSGGAPLAAMYQSQAELPASRRITPDVSPVGADLSSVDLPKADAVISVGGHLGQGRTLGRLLDAAVVNEDDPIPTDPAVDIYDPTNGFRLPVKEIRFDPGFVSRVRTAQRIRVEQLDRVARGLIDSSDSARTLARRLNNLDIADRDLFKAQRRAATRTIMVIYRTMADPAMLDISIDPDDRVAGGFDSHPRPDIQNYAMAGFAHYLSPRAWLSTWSATSSLANMTTCLPHVTVPTFFVHYAGDVFVRMADLRHMMSVAGAEDVSFTVVGGADHYGREIARDGSLGERVTAGTGAVCEWLLERFTP
jgi:hypothetical protein